MARRDDITGKRRNRANKVSHSKRRTNTFQEVNLQTKRFKLEDGTVVKLKVSTRTLKTIRKKGLQAVLKDHAKTV